MERNELSIDLAKEKFNFSELTDLNKITAIRFWEDTEFLQAIEEK